MRRRSQLARLLVLALLFGALALPGYAALYVERPPFELEDGLGGGYTGGPGSVAVSVVRSGPLGTTIDNMRPGRPVRVAMFSSGVDTSVLPSSFSSQITLLGNSGDLLGYGTYAASVILQLNESSSITSLGLYPGGLFNTETFRLSLAHVINHPSDFDVVLFAFPTSDYLDPITSAMASPDDAWDRIQEAIADAPHYTSNGAHYGVAMDETLFNNQTISYANWAWLEAFRGAVSEWDTAINYIKLIKQAGLSIVVSAGDLGPNPQSIFGLANLEEVITVGGYNPADPDNSRPDGQISTSTSSGPSIDHRIKPDLIAPTGVVGLMPSASKLATWLQSKSMLDATLTPTWTTTAASSVTPAKARVDTTLTGAAIAAMSVGAIAAGGVTDTAKQRGALYLRSIPLDGVQVWRQGHGLLGGTDLSLSIPTSTVAANNPLFTNQADLGIEPDTGVWSVTATVVGGSVSSTAVSYRDFIGIDVLARTVTHTVTSTASVPVTTTVNSTGVVLTAPLGNDDKEAGEYCGYINTTSTATGSTTTVTDEIPWCLNNAIQPVGRAFAIHDRSSADQTYELSAALPPGASAIEHPLHFLPVNPLSVSLFTKITGDESCIRYGESLTYATATATTCHGLGKFSNVPIGYYKVRVWADYGSPMTYTTSRVTSTATVTHNEDIGEQRSYSSFKTLLLPKAPGCKETYGPRDDWSGHNPDEVDKSATQGWLNIKMWKTCSQEWIENELIETQGAGSATYDPATAGWKMPTHTVTTTVGSVTTATVVADGQLQVNLGYMRKAIQAAVTSRYIDIVHPCREFRYLSLRSPQILTVDDIANAATGTVNWSPGCNNVESFTAQLTSGGYSTGNIGLGTAYYPFNLTTPNYKAHMNLNFSYELHNAAIIVTIITGSEISMGLVTPDAVTQLPPIGPDGQIDLGKVTTTGVSSGKASFDWTFLPRGVESGIIYFTFVPSQHAQTAGLQTLGSWATIKDKAVTNDTLSFELDTWSVAEWPAMNFYHRLDHPRETCWFYRGTPEFLKHDDCGHSFKINPNYNPITTSTAGAYTGGQISGECRQITGDQETADVCEDWVILAHSPRGYATDVSETAATLMDVIPVYPSSDTNVTKTYTSLMSDVISGGGYLFTPPDHRIVTATMDVGFSGTILEAQIKAIEKRAIISTDGSFFDQLLFTRSFLSSHMIGLEVCINDGLARSTSNCGGTYYGLTDTWATSTATATAPSKLTQHPNLKPYVPYRKSAGLI